MTAPESPPDLLLPRLTPTLSINRPLSTPEYYHACIGRSPHTLDSAREIVFVLEGEGRFDIPQWEDALARVVAMNPGTRLRVHGRRLQARWRSDGNGPRLRHIPDCRWDGFSPQGSDFITGTALDLENGPSLELLLCESASANPDSRPDEKKTARVIVRVLHAVMDGLGIMHFLEEMFRALRGETLLGCNAGFSDTDLMKRVAGQRKGGRKLPPAPLTGGAYGDEQGDSWQRLSLSGPQSALLARTALAMAEFARNHDGLRPVRMAFPVNLRRHCPGLLSTMNFSSMLHVDLEAGDDVDDVREEITRLLAMSAETSYPAWLDYLRCLPLSWLDRLVSRTPANFRQRRILETAVISNIGHYRSEKFSGAGFRSQRIFGIPLQDNAFAMLFSMDDRTDITLGMANVYASDDRMHELMKFMREKLEQKAP